MPKKLNKTYFGIPKTPIDDSTVFYASFDGTTVAEVGSITSISNDKGFSASATGLGLKSNLVVNSETLIQIKNIYAIRDLMTIDCLVEVKNILIPNNSALQFGFGFSNGWLRVKSADLVPNSINHIRVIKNGSNRYTYVNGKSVSPMFYEGDNIVNSDLIVRLSRGSDASGIACEMLSICDLHISNIDRGAVFATLPDDFINGKAVIAPAFNPQRNTYTDALMAQYKVDTIQRDNGKWELQGSRPTLSAKKHIQSSSFGAGGAWIANDNIIIKGLAGEIISGVIDTDTALATVVKASGVSSNVIYLDDVSKFTLGDTIRYYQIGLGSLNTDRTITAIDTTLKTITIDTSYNQVLGDLVFENTATTSAPVVKYNNAGTMTTVAGTWSGLGTNEATFTLGTNAGLTTQDLQIEYSLNAPAGQGKVPVYEQVLGGEVNGRKLVPTNSLTIRDDFKGKVAGSNIECPHTNKATWYSESNSALLIPSSALFHEIGSYTTRTAIDGSVGNVLANNIGNIPQELFSFNLIRLVEDKLGMPIPAVDKVAWLKANLNKVTANWYGYGTCPAGNKATTSWWNSPSNLWESSASHTTGATTVISNWTTAISSRIDSSGFVHFLAYTDASDGVTASTIYTDYIYIDVEIKTPTGYDIIAPENPRRDDNWKVRTEDAKVTNDFVGKVLASVVENPHKAMYQYGTSLIVPTGSWNEHAQVYIDKLKSLDNIAVSTTTPTNLQVAQQLFSYNIIEQIERKYGKIPSTDKVAWAKDNLDRITANWYGFGTCPAGNKAYLDAYAVGGWNWKANNASSDKSHTSATVSPIVIAITTPNVYVQTDGFVHFVAYTDASNGTVASTINTDYINCEVILKPDAITQLQFFKSLYKRSNVLLVKKETKEVLTMFPASNEDRVSVVGKYSPPAPLAPSDYVTILAEIPEFLVTDLSSAVGDKQGTHHWKNILYKLGFDKTNLLGQFGYGRTKLSEDSIGVNTGSKVQISQYGLGNYFTVQFGISTIKKPMVGIMRYLVVHNGELKLFLVGSYSSTGSLKASSDTNGTYIGVLVPITGRPLVKEVDGISRAFITPTSWITPDEEIQGYVNENGEVVVTYQ